jgi:mannosyltransferase OCH1-like enzyme
MNYVNFETMDKFLLNSNGFIIHQIWFGIIPNKNEAEKTMASLSKFRDSWLIKNPTWVYKCWNLTDCRLLIKIYFPKYLNMYDKYPYIIQKCDCVRYCILYRYGGLYADMDYYCNRSWDKVIKDYPGNLYITETPNKITQYTQISNSLMYSKPNNPFWKHLLLEMEKSQKMPLYYSKHMIIMYTTGPCIIDRIFHKYKEKYSLKTYPYKLFHPFGITSELKVNNTSIYSYHLQKGSWNTIDTNIINFLYKDYKILIFIIFIMIVPSLIFSLKSKK